MSEREPASTAITSRQLEPDSWPSGRPIVVAMIAVVICFSVSLGVSHIRMQSMEGLADDILQNALPSIEHLTSMLTELRRVGMSASEIVISLENGQRLSPQDIRQARSRLDQELTAHESLPRFPGETELLAEITGALALLDETTEELLAERDTDSLAAARTTLIETFRPRIRHVDAAIQRLIRLNAEYTRARTKQILAERRAGSIIAGLLGGLSILIALIASSLVLRALRAHGRLMEEHRLMLAARTRELEAFTGRVAHDLRDPLGAISLRLQAALQSQTLDPMLRETLGKLGRQVERMNQIVTSLLDFARAGGTPPSDAQANLGAVLDGVLADVQLAADEANAEFCVDPFPPTLLACTKGALTSVLSNLVSNAVKYIIEGTNHPRRISIRVKAQDGMTHVEIEDTGPGLPPGCEQYIFEPFRQLKETRQPGVGLGLATVKKFVEAFKGKCGVRSIQGQGSCFWFALPTVASEPRLPPASKPHESQAAALVISGVLLLSCQRASCMPGAPPPNAHAVLARPERIWEGADSLQTWSHARRGRSINWYSRLGRAFR